jgi:hypothetical protein
MCPRLRNSVRVSTAPMPSTATVGHRTESLLEGQHLQLGDQFASIDPQLAGAHRQTAHFLAHDFGAVGVEEVRGSKHGDKCRCLPCRHGHAEHARQERAL